MYYVSHIWCNWCRRRMFQEKHSKWKRVDKRKIFSLQESTLISISANNGIRFFQVREGKLVSIHFDEKRRGQTKPETRYEQEIKHLLERLLFCLKTIWQTRILTFASNFWTRDICLLQDKHRESKAIHHLVYATVKQDCNVKHLI